MFPESRSQVARCTTTVARRLHCTTWLTHYIVKSRVPGQVALRRPCSPHAFAVDAAMSSNSIYLNRRVQNLHCARCARTGDRHAKLCVSGLELLLFARLVLQVLCNLRAFEPLHLRASNEYTLVILICYTKQSGGVQRWMQLLTNSSKSMKPSPSSSHSFITISTWSSSTMPPARLRAVMSATRSSG